MTLEKPDIKELKALVEWMNTASDVRELSVKYGDVELFVSRNENSGHGSAPDAQAAAPSAPAASSTANQAPPAAAPTEDAG
ncbi:hypothetical protein [Nesterenkonia pannonica]|nr:hypothetical protein [Nesterenkonia pannonica]